MDTITAIKKALEGVTPGPWVTYEGSLGYKGDVYAPTAKSVKDCHHIARCFAPKPAQHPLCDLQAIKVVDNAVAAVEANTIYIAAVNPEAISELLASLESLQRENEELRERQLAWRPMDSAPKDGKHCILSIPTGSGFIYSAQGVFRDGKWDNALNIDAQPLAWMPNVLLPDELCPWLNPDPIALSSTGDTHGN